MALGFGLLIWVLMTVYVCVVLFVLPRVVENAATAQAQAAQRQMAEFQNEHLMVPRP